MKRDYPQLESLWTELVNQLRKDKSPEEKLGGTQETSLLELEKNFQHLKQEYPHLAGLWQDAKMAVTLSRRQEVNALVEQLNLYYPKEKPFPRLSTQFSLTDLMNKAYQDLEEVTALIQQKAKGPQDLTLPRQKMGLSLFIPELAKIVKREALPEPETELASQELIPPKPKTTELPSFLSQTGYFPCEQKLIELLKLPEAEFNPTALLETATQLSEKMTPQDLRVGNQMAVIGLQFPPGYFDIQKALMESKALRQIHFNIPLDEALPLERREKNLLEFLGLSSTVQSFKNNKTAIKAAEEVLRKVSSALASFSGKPGPTGSFQFYPEYQAVLKAQQELREIEHLHFEATLGERFSDSQIHKLFGGPLEELHFSQGNVGDCYLLAALYVLSRDPDGRNVIQNMLRRLDSETYQVTLFDHSGKLHTVKVPENNVRDTSSFNRILEGIVSSPDRVKGPKGLRILERAYGKSIKPLNDAGNQPNATIVALDKGGQSETALSVLTGWKRYNSTDMKEVPFEYVTRKNCLKDLPPEALKKVKAFLHSLVTEKDQYILTVSTAPTERGLYKLGKNAYMDRQYRFVNQHAYGLEKVEEKNGEFYLTIVNPHDTRKKRYELTMDEFCQYFYQISGVQKAFPDEVKPKP